MKKLLVTGAGGPAGNNFISSLRMADEPFFIIGGDTNRWHLELSDSDSVYLLPPATDEDYIDSLNKLIKREDIEFVHPQPDVEVAAISERREEIEARTFLPSEDTIRLCQNKMKFNKALKKKGIPSPDSFLIKKEEDVEKNLTKLLEKYPKKAWLRAIRGAGAKASLPVKEASHAKMWIDYWEKFKGLSYKDFMISEYLPGKEIAFQSLWKNGEIITSQARERLEYVFGHLTPSGQTSSPAVARTVSRKDVNEIATRAVKELDDKASGVFCVDMKENYKGIPCITEINAGRFFTTCNFFSQAGSNMPYYYVKLGYSEGIPQLRKYDPLPEGFYWIRSIDMGYKLVKGDKWKSRRI